MVEGGSSPSRGPANYGDCPLFIERGDGAVVTDVDGNRYIDWMMAYGALPLGHAHPAIVAAISQAAQTGTLFAAATEIEVEVAERISSIVPGAERVRFANTGTEAAMAALRLARGYTGRPKFIKFEGHYHGWHDDFLLTAHPHAWQSLGHPRDPIAIAESSGLNRRSLEDTILVPWNDLEAVERVLDVHRGQVAAIFTEGAMANMGVIPPRAEYLKGLRQLATESGSLLVIDETVTGFRVARGGCQEHYGVQADLAVFGKALGAGLPVAALTGKAKIMEALAWGGVLHYGTQNASRVGMAAARASLDLLDEAFFKRLNFLAEQLCIGLRAIFEQKGISAIVQNVGPMFQIFFTELPRVENYRQFCAHVNRTQYQKFALALFPYGIYMSPSPALHSVVTGAHKTEHVEATLEAVDQVCDELSAS